MKYVIRFTQPTEVYVSYPRGGAMISIDSVVIINKKSRSIK